MSNNKSPSVHTITEAKANLSKLIQKALAGETVFLGANRNPEVVIMRYEQSKPKRIPGVLEGKGYWISPNFNAQDKEIEDLFYGKVNE